MVRGGITLIPDTPPKESHLAKLRRLQAEVRQLEADLGEGGSAATATRPSVTAKQPVDVVSELSTLREKLTLASSSVDINATAVEPQLQLPRAADATSPPKPIDSELDKRLAALERLVGTSEREEPSLSESLTRLDHLVSILTQPRHLDSISRRVKLLLADLDRASASRKPDTPSEDATTLTSEEYEHLQSLFKLLPRLDPLLPVIPPLLTRLWSLSTLHTEALGIAHDLREMQGADAGAREQEGELKAVVEGVRQGMAEAAGLIQGNWESLQGRISDLDTRIKRLNGTL